MITAQESSICRPELGMLTAQSHWRGGGGFRGEEGGWGDKVFHVKKGKRELTSAQSAGSLVSRS